MEQAPPPDFKRQRLPSWSSPSGGVSLPRPHNTTTNPLPPPRAHNPHSHQPQPSSYTPFTTRPNELHSSAPPTPIHPGPAQLHPDSERRHHEQEPFAPMHDHYQAHPQHHPQHHHQPPPPPPPQQQQQLPPHQQQQPPPVSPAQGPYQPSYAHRDPGSVKREPTEDSRRPSSTGHPADGPAPSHPSHPSHHQLPPPSYPETQPRHMSYDNGHPVPPSAGGYRQPSYPPPTPVAQQASYDAPQHHSYPSGGGDQYFGVYTTSVPAKKKNTRASQACDQCRQLKAKCDETKPCKTCRDKGLECRYRDPVPKATDKAQADILDGIQTVQSTLTLLVDRFDRMDERLAKMESALSQRHDPVVVKRDTFSEEDSKDRQHIPNANSAPSYQAQPAAPVQQQPRPQPHQSQPQSQGTYFPVGNGNEGANAAQAPDPGQGDYMNQNHNAMHMMGEDEPEAEPGPPVPPGEPAIPINHTTLAGLLLEWPSIRELTQHHVEKNGVRYVTEYPIGIEQNRGPLLVYGRGEDNHHSRHIREAIDHGIIDMTDDSSDVAPPSPAADFGLIGGLSPPDMVEYKGGVLAFDGNPDFSEIKVWAYVESFKENILNMHPIITPKMLDYWVRYFLDTLPVSHPRSAKPQGPKPTFAIMPASTPEATGSKRKRSPGPDTEGPMTPGPVKTGKPTRSIHSALVLTILALGKICLHRENIPDVVHQTVEVGPNGSPVIRNGIIPSSPALGQASPPALSSQSSAQTSPKDQGGRGGQSRRPSIHGPSNQQRSGYHLKRNYDVIAGLEYFAYATDILGNLEGSYNNMKNVYANIFAGLYQGQLGRPLESFAFIHKASHKLQVIMRPSLDKLRNFKYRKEFIVESKYNQIALAFWTCLQLESDLIAEMPLPPSGLLSYEDDMPHPNMSLLDGFDQRVLDSYPGQLYLRTHLNSIHRMFYAPDDPNKAENDKFQNVDLVADAVSGMHWVARSFAFKEDDGPGQDILAARLRAKYWGAQVITYRPFVRQILEFSHSVKNQLSPSDRHLSEFRHGIIAPSIPHGARSLTDIEPAMVELARKGIKALIESTRAFHNLGDRRPIITNIFGTAHAQWGNLLVLSAAFRDPVLHPFVDEELLKTLFHRTIAFFRQSATATSSLRIDMLILEGLQRDLFYGPDPRANSSFSSQTSAPPPRASTAATPHNLAQTPQMPQSVPDSGIPGPPISPMGEAYHANT